MSSEPSSCLDCSLTSHSGCKHTSASCRPTKEAAYRSKTCFDTSQWCSAEDLSSSEPSYNIDITRVVTELYNVQDRFLNPYWPLPASKFSFLPSVRSSFYLVEDSTNCIPRMRRSHFPSRSVGVWNSVLYIYHALYSEHIGQTRRF